MKVKETCMSYKNDKVLYNDDNIKQNLEIQEGIKSNCVSSQYMDKY